MGTREMQQSGRQTAENTRLQRVRDWKALGASVEERDAGLGESWIAAFIGFAVFAFHAWHVPAFTQAAIFERDNVAFDFDIGRFVQLWCAFPFPSAENQDYYAVRHPLAIVLRLACAPLVQTGLDARVLACTIAAALTALSASLSFRIAAKLGAERSIAFLFAALWSVSTTVLVPGDLPESYRLALLALGFQFLIAIRWIDGHPFGMAVRIAAGVANFGITITNAALSGLTEFVCRLAREPFVRAVRGTVVFGVGAGIVSLMLTAASFTIWPVENVDGPVRAVKQVYWSAFSGGAAGGDSESRQGAADVAWTFGVTSFVAPAFGRYPSGVPSNPYLWDFRGQDYGTTGWAAVFGWLVLLVYGVAAAAKDRERWPLWGIAALWIAFNVGLHSYWQYRGSVFLYAAHAHPAFFVVALAGVRHPLNRLPYGTLVYGAALALVVLLMALNNVPLYLELARLN